MQNSMTKTLYSESSLAKILFANILFIAIAKIRISLIPVPITMQTFGIFLLPAIYGRKISFFAISIYLIEASLGLPVLATASGINPKWFLGPSCGFLIGFPIASYFIDSIYANAKNDIKNKMKAIFLGLLIVFGCGVAFLTLFCKYTISQAIAIGLFPFIPGEILKASLFLSLTNIIKRFDNEPKI